MHFVPHLGRCCDDRDVQRRTTVLMCRPDYFDVSYRINPWMEPDEEVNVARAVTQWESLRDTYTSLDVEVAEIDPIRGLNDMVFAANGAFVLDGVAYGAKFTVSQRADEAPAYLARLAELGFEPVVPRFTNEGEGDMLVVGDTILGGYGFRTDPAAHAEVSALFDREVVSLRLVDERFYHLDTALTVLPGGSVAYYPEAFDEASRAELRRRFPDAIEVGADDALVFGLNSFRVDETMVVSSAAKRFPTQLRDRGLTVATVDLSELMLGGGGIKCCTLELRT